jgi:L-ascorbate metabolism protein UlaG (beta-lactamase superfamily)
MRITYVGHSTVLIELDGLRVLTDPVLRGRVAHVLRGAPPVDLRTIGAVDVVLVSHMHHDHFDPPSLRMIEGGPALIAPRGTERAVARLEFERVTELGVGESVPAGNVGITATPALHRRGRLFARGTQRVYFAGDTDIFPEMSALRGGLDAALLPVGGWGPKLGPGHLDPRRAAEALALLEPRVAVPIHWGTFHRIGLRRAHRALSNEAPQAFARAAAEYAPSVDVRILKPGETTVVEPVRS